MAPSPFPSCAACPASPSAATTPPHPTPSQPQGQKDIAPAEAQVIFSSKPLWAVGLAWLLLGGEELGPLTWAGGGALVAAGLLASSGQPARGAASAADAGEESMGPEQAPQPQPVLARRGTGAARDRR
jgi:hypothetical protein